MIEIKNTSFKYSNSETGNLKNINLKFDEGSCILLCGKSGCGKTTLTRLINGLIPHYYDGELSGSVTVNGIDISKSELYDISHHVGSVFQNPRSQFFCVDTTSEIAFGCENLGLPVSEIENRIHDTTNTLKINKLLGRNIFNLSGGEKQKIACASVSAVNPSVYVLDEPTANLDVDAIEDLKKTILFWKTQGKTIIIAEHRLYYLRDICDRVIYMDNGEVQLDISMKEFCSFSTEKNKSLGLRNIYLENIQIENQNYQNTKLMYFNNFIFSYPKNKALSIDALSIPSGNIIAVIGHNGAGKSTFCHCLCGLEKRFKGTISFDKEKYNYKAMLKRSYMVMQDVNHQLFCESVEDEVTLGIVKENKEYVSAILSKLDLQNLVERHPMSLSGGQKQRVAIASAILADKEILIFDEPTSGLDFEHMEQTAELISSLAGEKTIFIITHDPELIVRCCSYVIHLENGSVLEQYELTKNTKERFLSFFRI